MGVSGCVILTASSQEDVQAPLTLLAIHKIDSQDTMLAISLFS